VIVAVLQNGACHSMVWVWFQMVMALVTGDEGVHMEED